MNQTLQQACGTDLETTVLVANTIALGQIDVGIACEPLAGPADNDERSRTR